MDRKRATPADCLFAALLIVGATILFVKLDDRIMGEKVVAIYCENRLYARYPLSEDRIVVIPGAAGPAKLTIANGEAFISFSPCRNQICVHSQAIKGKFGQIVCVPGKYVVKVESLIRKDLGVLDAIIQ